MTAGRRLGAHRPDRSFAWAVVAIGWLAGAEVTAQGVPSELARERADLARWLADAPTSPYRALAQLPIGPGITLGPAPADLPLPNVAGRLTQRGGSITLTTDAGARPLPRDRAVGLGEYQLVGAGLTGQAVVTVFGRTALKHHPPEYYPHVPTWQLTVALEPPSQSIAQRMLTAEGLEVEATEAGSVAVPVGGKTATLRVFRIPTPGVEESELEIYFRDATNGNGSYPAGRFVNLIPLPGGRYALDLNRARNPFCAYNTVYPCPAPWRGNTLPLPVEAGERYRGDPIK